MEERHNTNEDTITVLASNRGCSGVFVCPYCWFCPSACLLGSLFAKPVLTCPVNEEKKLMDGHRGDVKQMLRENVEYRPKCDRRERDSISVKCYACYA